MEEEWESRKHENCPLEISSIGGTLVRLAVLHTSREKLKMLILKDCIFFS